MPHERPDRESKVNVQMKDWYMTVTFQYDDDPRTKEAKYEVFLYFLPQ